VAHGALLGDKGDQPIVWLEAEDGKADPVAGEQLVDHLAEVAARPRLVVLCSCQGAGAGVEPTSQDGGMMAALGPRLAERGYPAVVAMQGNVTMITAGLFLDEFFKVLRDPKGGGQIDGAMAAGRAAIRNRPDHWAPTLFLRLKSGSLWYVPG